MSDQQMTGRTPGKEAQAMPDHSTTDQPMTSRGNEVQPMRERANRPLRRRAQMRVFRVINVPMRALLSLPFATPLGRNLTLAYITGRKTARIYRQPLSYVRDGDMLLTPGGGNWKLNLSAGVPVRLRLRARTSWPLPRSSATLTRSATC